MKRNPKSGRLESLPIGQIRHKRMLKQKGWSYREACREMGYALSHFAAVLNGYRESKTVLRKIEALPKKEEVAA
jgi:hypothetical protein